MYKVCLLIGSNLSFRNGEETLSPGQIIEQADIQLIDELLPDYLEVPDLNEAVRTSSTIQTRPCGVFSEQVPDFFNQVFECVTDKSPDEVLEVCQSIENRFGRKRSKNAVTKTGERIYESRTLDIDILLVFEKEELSGAVGRRGAEKWKHLCINSINLQVPHPKLQERDFAQKLLAELGEK